MQRNDLETIDRLIVRNHAAQEQSYAIRKQLWMLRDRADEHQLPGIGQAIALLDAEVDRLTVDSANLAIAWGLAFDDQFGTARKGVLAVVK